MMLWSICALASLLQRFSTSQYTVNMDTLAGENKTIEMIETIQSDDQLTTVIHQSPQSPQSPQNQRIIWCEVGQPERELIHMDVPLNLWDVVRMLEPTFSKYGSKPILSFDESVKLNQEHFTITTEMMSQERPGAVLTVAVKYSERAGWIMSGTSSI